MVLAVVVAPVAVAVVVEVEVEVEAKVEAVEDEVEVVAVAMAVVEVSGKAESVVASVRAVVVGVATARNSSARIVAASPLVNPMLKEEEWSRWRVVSTNLPSTAVFPFASGRALRARARVASPPR